VSQTEQLEQLRELFLAAPESHASRVLAITFSLVLVASVLWLVRRRHLREEYTPIWMIVAAALVVVSLRVEVLQAITRAIGAWTLSSTLFALAQLFLVLICLNYSVRLSKNGLQLKNLAQEVALLRAELEGARRATGGVEGRPRGVQPGSL
jgi:hypothetical protein